MIVLSRCDDRLIHGQCMTVIVKEYDIKEIIVVDEFTATNKILASVFKAAVPPSMKANVYTVEDSIDKIENAINNNVRTMVLMKSPVVFNELIDRIPGIPKELNIGPQSNRKDTVQIHTSIHLLSSEISAIREIANKGVHVFFRQIPTHPIIEWDDIKENY